MSNLCHVFLYLVTQHVLWSLLGRLFWLGLSAHSETQGPFWALPHLSDYNHWLRTGWRLRLSREVSSYSHYGGFYYTQPAVFIHKPWSSLKQSPAVCLSHSGGLWGVQLGLPLLEAHFCPIMGESGAGKDPADWPSVLELHEGPAGHKQIYM